MSLSLSRDEQVKILRNAVIAMRKSVAGLANPLFDADIFEMATTLSEAVNNGIHDACVDLLRTDDEIDEITRQMFENERFGSDCDQVRGTYYHQQMGV